MTASQERRIGTVLSFVLIFLKIGVTFFYIPFVLRMIGNDGYGLFTVVSSVVAYIAILDFGINDSTLRFFIKFKTLDKKAEKNNILSGVSKIYSVVGVVVIFISIIIYFFLDDIFKQSFSVEELDLLKKMYLISAVSVFFTLIFNPVGAILSAYEKFIILKVTDVVVFLLTTVTIMVFLYLGYGILIMVIIPTILNILNIIFKVWFVKKKLSISYPFYGSSQNIIKQIITYASPIFIVVIVEQIYWKLDNILIGAILGTTFVTFYAMGVVFQKYILSFATAISRIMTPSLISNIDVSQSINKLSLDYIKVSRIQLLIVMPIIVNLILWGREFLIIWLGKEFSISYTILLLVMIPFSIEIIGNLRNTFLQVYGFYWYRASILLLISLINVGATVYLLTLYGITGAAFSTCISLLLGYTITNYLLWKKIKLNIKLFFSKVWLEAALPLMLTVVFSGIIKWNIKVDNWFILIAVVILSSAFYTACMWYFYLSSEEKLKLINR